STGLPCVGRNGTVVSFPHCEQFVRVSVFGYECPRDGPRVVAPSTATRLPLQFLQRLGSFLNCLSWKNDCSPAVNTKSVPQSTHFKTLSWYSIGRGAPIPASLLCTGDPNRERSGSHRGQWIYIPLLLTPWIRPAIRYARVGTAFLIHRDAVCRVSNFQNRLV